MLLQHIEIRVGSSHVARREPHEFTLPRLVDYRGSYSPTNLLHTLKSLEHRTSAALAYFSLEG
jgi:hypothetical protein